LVDNFVVVSVDEGTVALKPHAHRHSCGSVH